MKAADFQPGFPGELVEAAFTERIGNADRIAKGLAFVPNPLPPADLNPVEFIGRVYEELDRAKTNLVKLDTSISALPEPKIILSAMITREAQSSSKIENTFASLKEIAVAELKPEQSRNETLEVIRNRRAIELALKSSLPMGRALICEMHKTLITDRSKRPGQLRDIQVCIGDEHRGFSEARFVPPPPTHIAATFEAWERFVRTERTEASGAIRWPELIQLAFSHYQFETIHPFSDGNGRLGRAIVNLTPVRQGWLNNPVCNLSEWVQQNRQEYYDRLLRVSTHGEWEGWVRFFCRAISEQALLDFQRVDRINKLWDKYIRLISAKKRSSLLGQLLEQLFTWPVVSIPQAAERLGISYTAAQRHVEFLVELGVLKQLGKDRVNKVFIAGKILDAIRGQGED